MGRASSSARTATAFPGGPMRAMRPVPATRSTLWAPRAFATSPAVTCSPWLGSGVACSRSRSVRACGSSSSREYMSVWRSSVDTQVTFAGLFGLRTVEQGDLGPLDAQVAVQEVFREPGADYRIGLERPEGLFEGDRKPTDTQADRKSVV